MLDFIGTIASAIYTAFTAFALTAQALAPILPWQASVAVSGVLAGIVAVSTWAFLRIFRKH